jgi:hypothetical protein
VYVANGIVGQTLTIYRSEDGAIRTLNTPVSSCVLNPSKICSFITDHLSYFGFYGPSDGNRSTIGNGQTCNDADGCVCDGTNINNGQTCVVSTTTTSHGGGSIQLSIDDCKRNSAKVINLPGANDE